MKRKSALAGNELRAKDYIEEILGKRIPESDANRFASLAQVPASVVDDLRRLIDNRNRLGALLLLGFYVADDGASEDDLYKFIGKLVGAEIDDPRPSFVRARASLPEALYADAPDLLRSLAGLEGLRWFLYGDPPVPGVVAVEVPAAFAAAAEPIVSDPVIVEDLDTTCARWLAQLAYDDLESRGGEKSFESEAALMATLGIAASRLSEIGRRALRGLQRELSNGPPDGRRLTGPDDWYT